MPSPIDPTALSRYGGLALVARDTVEGFLTGVHKSPYKGSQSSSPSTASITPATKSATSTGAPSARPIAITSRSTRRKRTSRRHLLVDASGSMAYQGKHAAASSSTPSTSPPRSPT